MDLISYNKIFFWCLYIELKVLDLRVPRTVFSVSVNRNVIYQDRQSQLSWLALALTSKYSKELVLYSCCGVTQW